jgi:hypothetical protein
MQELMNYFRSTHCTNMLLCFLIVWLARIANNTKLGVLHRNTKKDE